MLRSFLSFATLSLLAVACTEATNDSSSASSDFIGVPVHVTATPKCTEEPVIEGTSIFQDAKNPSVFYAVPSEWSIDPISVSRPVLEDTNGAWVTASQKLSPMLGSTDASFHLAAAPHASLETLQAKLAAAHPELTNVQVRLLPLEKAGDVNLQLFNPSEKDAKQQIVENGVTSLDVTVTFKTEAGPSAFAAFFSKKAATLILDVPASFACSGDGLSSRTIHLNAGGASMRFPGEGITLLDEQEALGRAVSVVNFAESFATIARLDHKDYSGMTELHDALDAALRPVLTAPASALHGEDLTTKASADAVAAIQAFKAANPDADVEDMLARATELSSYAFKPIVRAFQ